ncbi:MAG: helix-turn-helix domain-containing protein, partial [Bacteroidota bacterium]
PLMLRLVFLISPVFVCLFWSLTLMADRNRYAAPRRFLARFFLFTTVLFLAHFCYFAPYPEIYPWFDIPLQLIGIAIFPLFHIYFRLLTVDEKVSFRAHAKFFVIPALVGLIYIISVLITPAGEYHSWLYHRGAIPASSRPLFMEISRTLIRIVFPILLCHSLIANFLLIKKHGARAEEFYSDLRDKKNRNARILNFSLLGISLVSLVITSIGRDRLMLENSYIYLGWSAFLIIFYLLGFLGMKQRPINPTYDIIVTENGTRIISETIDSSIIDLSERIREEFDQNKIYLNSDLNIIDVAKAIGSNRSYISSAINHQFNQNFAAFVNSYRVEEVKRKLMQNQHIKMQSLAGDCGFGSINSMKRAVSANLGITLSDLREKVSNSELVN